MKFRLHKGGLQESMATEVEVTDLEALKALLEQHYDCKIESIQFDHVGMDARVGWDTYYVCVRREGFGFSQIVGMSDGKL